MADYKIKPGSMHDQLQKSRAKIQIVGGAYGNGKSAGACIKALTVAKNYPGCRILLARATLKKLNGTLRTEFVKWCPKSWIKSFPLPDKDSTTCKLRNGSEIDFRYIAQTGKGMGSETTSNVLGGTYDLIIVDQVEDPEITYKDFLDLLGRLRGTAVYRPDGEFDPTMPEVGPRWMILCCNPTGNWVYRKLVRPYELYRDKGIITEDLIYSKKHEKCLIELFEADAYSNVENTGQDFIDTLEATYRGQMRDRFILGKWANYEGLVYPQYDPTVHQIPLQKIKDYVMSMRRRHDGYIVQPHFFEAYDWGRAVPSCYLLAFVDPHGNIMICDGFYTDPTDDRENMIDRQAEKMRAIRMKWSYTVSDYSKFYGDPGIFKRSGPGNTIAEMFHDEGIYMNPANNDIKSGIIKVQSYLNTQVNHVHPIYGTGGAPYLYVSDHLTFFDDEIAQYLWKKSADGTNKEEPVDKDDHAMDTTKYLLTERPELATIIRMPNDGLPAWMAWQEQDIADNYGGNARYGR